MTFAYGALWVTSPTDGLLLRVDPASGEATTAAADLETPTVVTAGLDSLWVTLYGDHDATVEAGATTVVRLDPATLDVQGELAAGPMSTTGEVAVDETGVWVRNSTVFLTHYDPETYEPLEVIESSQGGGALLLAFDSVWATSYDFHNVWRFDPCLRADRASAQPASDRTNERPPGAPSVVSSLVGCVTCHGAASMGGSLAVSLAC